MRIITFGEKFLWGWIWIGISTVLLTLAIGLAAYEQILTNPSKETQLTIVKMTENQKFEYLEDQLLENLQN